MHYDGTTVSFSAIAHRDCQQIMVRLLMNAHRFEWRLAKHLCGGQRLCVRELGHSRAENTNSYRLSTDTTPNEGLSVKALLFASLFREKVLEEAKRAAP